MKLADQYKSVNSKRSNFTLMLIPIFFIEEWTIFQNLFNLTLLKNINAHIYTYIKSAMLLV